ncbi:MAG: cytochrome c biogenesis protein, partial [Rhodospirillaceae bacterium]|nr:cytochrome c biogenesis protein [Rhodospirillaceae bacterium]
MNAVPISRRLWRAFHQLGSPPYVYRLAGRLSPWLGVTSCALLAVGAFWGLILAPPDYLQGDSFRIIYIHVPSAYLSMG